MRKIINILKFILPIIKRLGRNPNINTMFKQLLLDAVKTAASVELSHLLDTFKQHNSEQDYNDLIISLQKSFGLLAKAAEQTKTKLDDTIVGIILNALPA